MRELKKYPNRRLYDLTDSHYVTVHDVRRMLLTGESIKVVDSRDGSDITRSILMQILCEQECDGHEPLLTTCTIERFIRLYGEHASKVASRYIEQSIVTFMEHQDELRGALTDHHLLSCMRQALERAVPDPQHPGRADHGPEDQGKDRHGPAGGR